jgi:hypothetical protein
VIVVFLGSLGLGGGTGLLATPAATRSSAAAAGRTPHRLPRTASSRARIWSSSSSDMRLTMMVMWQVRLRMRVARPRARGRQRFSVGPSSA